MFAYLGGNKPGTDMEKLVAKFSKEYKSHCRISYLPWIRNISVNLKIQSAFIATAACAHVNCNISYDVSLLYIEYDVSFSLGYLMSPSVVLLYTGYDNYILHVI